MTLLPLPYFLVEVFLCIAIALASRGSTSPVGHEGQQNSLGYGHVDQSGTLYDIIGYPILPDSSSAWSIQGSDQPNHPIQASHLTTEHNIQQPYPYGVQQRYPCYINSEDMASPALADWQGERLRGVELPSYAQDHHLYNDAQLPQEYSHDVSRDSASAMLEGPFTSTDIPHESISKAQNKKPALAGASTSVIKKKYKEKSSAEKRNITLNRFILDGGTFEGFREQEKQKNAQRYAARIAKDPLMNKKKHEATLKIDPEYNVKRATKRTADCQRRKAEALLQGRPSPLQESATAGDQSLFDTTTTSAHPSISGSEGEYYYSSIPEYDVDGEADRYLQTFNGPAIEGIDSWWHEQDNAFSSNSNLRSPPH